MKRSMAPRVTFEEPIDDEHEVSVDKPKITKKSNINRIESQQTSKSSNNSFAAKFHQKWTKALEENQAQISNKFQFVYEEECEPQKPRKEPSKRRENDDNAKIILADINNLVNKVQEICAKKAPDAII